jgi:transcriptional regulator with XRE-family HTH domain
MAEIGSTLREARIRARIDMSEVESRTKIRAKYLRAIENEEWDLLPGPVYVKSFLRTYGAYLGLDSRMLVDEFKRSYEGPSDHDATPIASLGRERDRDRDRGPRGPLMPPWAVIVLVLIVIVVALAVIGSSGGGKKSPAPTGLNAGPHHRARHEPKPRVTLPATPQVVNLKLVPTGTVYVCLVNAHGTKLIDEKTFSAGERVPTQAGRKLLLTLGNASVQVKVNGRTVPLAASPTAIRLLLTPTATQHIPSSMRPTCP